MEDSILKIDITRNILTANILKSVILRIDFLRIVNIQDFVSEVQKYLIISEFYLTNDTFVNNIEFEINDPDTLSSDNININQTIKRGQPYNFKNKSKDIEVIITENCIIFNIDCTQEYSLDESIGIFCDLVIMAQSKYNYINFVRLGLRKINNFICKDKNLYKCIEETFLPNIELQSIFNNELKCNKRQTIENFSYNEHLFNVIKVIQEGFVENIDRERAFNVILDIDGYLKEGIPNQFKDYTDIKKTIININNNIFNIFKSTFTEDFLNDLTTGASSKIEWGMKPNGKI